MNEMKDNNVTRETKEKYKNYGIFYINPDIDTNRNIGYLLCLPRDLNEQAKLVLQTNTNNYKKDDVEFVDSATEQVESVIDEFEGTSAPILMPIIPSEGTFQELGVECFDINIEDQYKRIDEQVLKCIENARVHCKNLTQKDLADKVLLKGNSKSGLFAQRFALLQPQIVDSVCISGDISDIPVPIEKYKGEELNYPSGIANYTELTNKQFNSEDYKAINFLYFATKQNVQDNDKQRKMLKKYTGADIKIYDGTEDLDVRNFYLDSDYYKGESKLLKFANQIRGMLDKFSKKEPEIKLLPSGITTNAVEETKLPGSLTAIEQQEFKRKQHEIYQTRQTAGIATERIKNITKDSGSIEL